MLCWHNVLCFPVPTIIICKLKILDTGSHRFINDIHKLVLHCLGKLDIIIVITLKIILCMKILAVVHTYMQTTNLLLCIYYIAIVVQLFMSKVEIDSGVKIIQSFSRCSIEDIHLVISSVRCAPKWRGLPQTLAPHPWHCDVQMWYTQVSTTYSVNNFMKKLCT